MIVVSDTSPITALLQIGQPALLRELYSEVVIPEAVFNELSVTHPELPAYIRIELVSGRAEVQRLSAELDLGEAEAIVLAKEKRADALLIDETEGRRVAAREGVRYIGLLGVLIQAKRMNKIKNLSPLLQQLETVAGFHLSEDVKQACLKQAGEL